MTITTEELRQALVAATKRIITLETELKAVQDALVLIGNEVVDRVAKLEDQIDIALGKPPAAMTEEQIARAMDATSWSPGNPTAINPIDRLTQKVSR